MEKMDLTKQDTLRLKGLAVMMMLWLHLFSNEDVVMEHVEEHLNFLNGHPLCYSLTRVCSMCVPIFLFLGGFGLSRVFEECNRKHMEMRNGRRFLSLMVNLWIVILLALPFGCWLNPSLFPSFPLKFNDAVTLVENTTGLSYSYNGAWWFLLPYGLLTLISQPLIRTLYKLNVRNTIIWCVACLVVHVIIYVFRDNVERETSFVWRLCATIMNTGYMLLMFSLGVAVARFRLLGRWRRWISSLRHGMLFAASSLVALLMLRMMLGSSALNGLPFVPLVIALCAVLLRDGSFSGSVFLYFGKHSTNLWLTHFFFFRYILDGEIYGLRYPVVIYVALLTLSTITSIIIGTLFRPFKRIIRG